MACLHTTIETHIKPLHCPCCGERVIDGGPPFIPRPEMREVRFTLSDGAVTAAQPMCAACASEPWTTVRLARLKKMFDAAYELSVRGCGYQQHPKTGQWQIVQLGTGLLVTEREQHPKADPQHLAHFKRLTLSHPDSVNVNREPIAAIIQ